METVALQQSHQPLHHQHLVGAAGVQPENWLYEIKQKGQDSTNTCYVMVQNVRVSNSKGFTAVAKSEQQQQQQQGHNRRMLSLLAA